MSFQPDANASKLLELCVAAADFSETFIRTTMYDILARRSCLTDQLTEPQIVQVVSWVQSQEP